MDADILRLILLILGGLVVVGIYLWERNKRINARVQAVRKEHPEERREPVLDGHESVEQSADRNAEAPADDLEQALHELGDLVSEEVKQAPRRTTEKKVSKKKLTINKAAGGKAATAPAPQPGDYDDPARTAQEDLFADEVLVESDHYRNADPSRSTW